MITKRTLCGLHGLKRFIKSKWLRDAKRFCSTWRETHHRKCIKFSDWSKFKFSSKGKRCFSRGKFLAAAVLRGLSVETVWWNCLSLPIFICMQIEEFSYKIGRSLSCCSDLWRVSRWSRLKAGVVDSIVRRQKGEPWFKFMQYMISLRNWSFKDDGKDGWKEFNKEKTHPFLRFWFLLAACPSSEC